MSVLLLYPGSEVKMRFAVATCLVIVSLAPAVQADFGVPYFATRAMSPDGNAIVRVESDSSKTKGEAPRRVSIYWFDAEADAFTRASRFTLDAPPSELMYVADDASHIAFVGLYDSSQALRIYDKSGKRIASFKLEDLLTTEQIAACGETGSTVQWFGSGGFNKGSFYFEGPSQTVKGLKAPLTLMKQPNKDAFFSGRIDLKTMTLTMDE